MACLETDEVFVVWLLDWRCGLDSKKTTYKSNWISSTNGKNRKKQKQKQKQNKNDQIDILRLKQSFFFRDCVQPPLSFPQIWNPAPWLCRAASKTGGFAQRIHWFCVDERLNLVKQYLTSEKSDSLGPKLSALQLWDCLGEHVEQPPWIMTRRASCCVPLCTNNFRGTPLKHSTSLSTMFVYIRVPPYSRDFEGLFTWSGGPRSSGVGFFCFVSPRAWKQKKPTPLDRGPPLHVNRP